MKNKTLQTLGIIGLAVTIAATTGLLLLQQQQLVYASSMGSEGRGEGEEEAESNIQGRGEGEEEAESNIQEGGERGSDCSTTRASDPELEGWLIETCDNGDVTWIRPDGTRCVANEEAGTTACEGETPTRVN